MYLRAIGRGFTQMTAYFLVMNSKRCNEMKRDGRQKKKKWKKPKIERGAMHALVVSVTRFSFWSHFEAVLELYLFSCWSIIIIIVIIVVIIIIIIMSFFFRYNTYQTVHKLIKELTVRISHSVQLYLKLSLFKTLLLKRSVFILGNWLDLCFNLREDPLAWGNIGYNGWELSLVIFLKSFLSHLSKS